MQHTSQLGLNFLVPQHWSLSDLDITVPLQHNSQFGSNVLLPQHWLLSDLDTTVPLQHISHELSYDFIPQHCPFNDFDTILPLQQSSHELSNDFFPQHCPLIPVFETTVPLQHKLKLVLYSCFPHSEENSTIIIRENKIAHTSTLRNVTSYVIHQFIYKKNTHEFTSLLITNIIPIYCNIFQFHSHVGAIHRAFNSNKVKL